MSSTAVDHGRKECFLERWSQESRLEYLFGKDVSKDICHVVKIEGENDRQLIDGGARPLMVQ